MPTPTLLPKIFADMPPGDARTLEFMKTMHAYMQNMTSADVYYHTVPIITFDRKQGRYVYRNTISDEFYNELLIKTPLQAERDEMERVFRPAWRLDSYLDEHGIDKSNLPQPLFERIVGELNLNRAFINYQDYIASKNK